MFTLSSLSRKSIAVFLLFIFWMDIFSFQRIYAQTDGSNKDTQGPAQSNGGFSADPFTGDFGYSIVLLDVEGFPITINYNSNYGVLTPASWVGLGWNLNVGSVNRSMRGIPDEFNEDDEVEHIYNQRTDATIGSAEGWNQGVNASITFGIGGEDEESAIAAVGGGIGISLSTMGGSYTNSYRGFGRTFEESIGGALFGFAGLGGYSVGANLNGGLGYSRDNQNGISTSITGGAGFGINSVMSPIFGLSSSNTKTYNTRTGIETIARTRSTTTAGGLFSGNTLGATTYQTMNTQSSLPPLPTQFLGRGNTFLKGRGFYASVSVIIGAGIQVDKMKKDYDKINRVQNTAVSYPAYGYFNNELAEDDPDKKGIMDYNRENEQVLTKETNILPYSTPTYDVFNVNVGSASGSYRAFRNDVGTYTTSSLLSTSVNSNEIDIKSYGLFYKKTEGSGESMTDIRSGMNDETSFHNFSFVDKSDVQSNDFEKFYFKQVGEQTPVNMTIWDQYGGELAMMPNTGPSSSNNAFVDLQSISEKDFNIFSFIASGSFDATDLTSVNNFQTGRNVRLNYFKYYSPEELIRRDWKTDIENHSVLNVGGTNDFQFTTIARDADYRKDHHISMIDVTDGSGVTYRFGVPVYSITEQQVSFSISNGSSDPNSDYTDIDNTGLVGYNHTGAFKDNSINNRRGRSNSFSKKITPAYSSELLISEIVSPDYVDLEQDNPASPNYGPSSGDIGNYLKFNYSMVYGGTSNPFKWRTPFSEENPTEVGYPKAFFDEGFKSDKYDDIARYEYGEKEVWYIKAVESKNFIAEFYLDDREDAFSVIDEDGGFDQSKPLKLLKKIVLYSREDRIKNGADAIPLKTVVFDYDYSLCQNYPGNVNYFDDGPGETGKLTLKSISIYEGNSKQLSQSPYTFEYTDGDLNPDFGYLSFDRWMNYKENNPALSNRDYPFDIESEQVANTNSQAWKLIKINTPGGSSLEVEYEADRYGYVQDKNAMKMFKVVGLANQLFHNINKTIPGNVPPTASNTFSNPVNNLDPYQYLYFELDEPIESVTPEQAKEIIREKYLKTNDNKDEYMARDNLYFRFMVDVRGGGDFEDMSGFTSYSSGEFGVVGATAPYNYGFIKLRNEKPKRRKNKSYEMNPIKYYALQFLRVNLAWKYLAVDQQNPNTGEPIFRYLDNVEYDFFFKEKSELIYNKLDEDGYCGSFDPQRSFIRLADPDRIKYAGGCRVKSITHKDNWNVATNEAEPSNSYKLVYDYQTDVSGGQRSNYQNTGVASYEPETGRESNPFYLPYFYTIENLYLPNDNFFQIDQFGSSVLPGAQVGYSRIEVQREPVNGSSPSTGTGKTIWEFTTSLDENAQYEFRRTKMDFKEYRLDDRKEGISGYLQNFNQGFSIVTNDMHGRMKSVENRNLNGELISKSEIDYYEYDEPQLVIDENGGFSQQFMSKEYDVSIDRIFNEQITTEASTLETFEVKVSLIPVNKSQVEGTVNNFVKTNAVSMSKRIHHHSIPKVIRSKYLDNESESAVLAFDYQSGSPVVTNIPNEYSQIGGLNNDNESDVNFKAHWKYKKLSGKYLNDGFELPGVSIDNGGLVTVATSDLPRFEVGDLLEVYDDNQSEYYYYHVVDKTESENTIRLIDEDGNYAPVTSNDVDIKVIESGYENRPAEDMAYISFLYDMNDTPIAIGGTGFNFNYNKVYAAGAVEYGYADGLDCKLGDACLELESNSGYPYTEGSVNPFTTGVLNSLVPVKQYVYQIDLENDDVNTATNVRYDGNFQSLVPFYALSSGNWYAINEPDHPQYDSADPYQKWRDFGNVLRYDKYGRVIAYESNTGVKESVLYGYNFTQQLLPRATVYNADYNQIAFDDFEDYNYLDFDVDVTRNLDHFSFKDYASQISTLYKHTGRYSLEIAAGNNVMVKRSFEAGDEDPGIAPQCCETIEAVVDAGTPPDNIFTPTTITFTKTSSTTYQGDVLNASLSYSALNQQWQLSYTVGLFGFIILSENCPFSSNFCPALWEWPSPSKLISIQDITDPGCPNGTVPCEEEIDCGVDSDVLNVGEDELEYNPCNCVPRFAPTAGKYLVSTWIKMPDANGKSNYDVDATVSISLTDVSANSTDFTINPTNVYVDGWRKYEGTFDVFNDRECIEVKIENNSGTKKIYVDDFRIHPFRASMSTIVYDTRTMLPMATSDNYNFFTSYVYDNNLRLTGVKTETIKGVETLREIRKGVAK